MGSWVRTSVNVSRRSRIQTRTIKRQLYSRSLGLLSLSAKERAMRVQYTIYFKIASSREAPFSGDRRTTAEVMNSTISTENPAFPTLITHVPLAICID